MDKILEIKGYWDEIQLKKVWFGGYSKEDVQAKIGMTMELLEKMIAERDEKEAELLANFEKEKETMREDFERKKKVSDILVNDLSKNMDELNKNVEELNRNNEHLIEMNRALKEKQEKTEILNEALKTEKYNLEQECSKLKGAYDEMTLIKNDLEQEQMKLRQSYDSLLEENHQMSEKQAKLKEAYRAYCDEILKEYTDSLKSLSGEFSRIIGNVSNIQKGMDGDGIFERLERRFESRESQVLSGTVE